MASARDIFFKAKISRLTGDLQANTLCVGVKTSIAIEIIDEHALYAVVAGKSHKISFTSIQVHANTLLARTVTLTIDINGSNGMSELQLQLRSVNLIDLCLPTLCVVDGKEISETTLKLAKV
uniref:Uncharacterized protein n=1 Tax=Glossina austeni TaxID=7395 RepID=A0A1A9VW55_GLOAU